MLLLVRRPCRSSACSLTKCPHCPPHREGQPRATNDHQGQSCWRPEIHDQSTSSLLLAARSA
jgi:hypothetical protein